MKTIQLRLNRCSHKFLFVKMNLLLIFFMVILNCNAQLKDKFFSKNVARDSVVRIKIVDSKIIAIDNEFIFENYDDIFSESLNYVFVKPGKHRFLTTNNSLIKQSELDLDAEFKHEYILQGKMDIAYIDTVHKVILKNLYIGSFYEKKTKKTVSVEKGYLEYNPFKGSSGVVHLYYDTTDGENQLSVIRFNKNLTISSVKGCTNDSYRVFYPKVYWEYFISNHQKGIDSIKVKPGVYFINLSYSSGTRYTEKNANLTLNIEPNTDFYIDFIEEKLFICPVIKQKDSTVSILKPVRLLQKTSNPAGGGYDLASSMRAFASVLGNALSDAVTNDIIKSKNIDGNLNNQHLLNNTSLKSLTFTKDGKYGFITSEDGNLLKTKDSGKKWKIIKNNRNRVLSNICFSDSLHGRAIGDTAIGMFATFDGGKTWLPSMKNTFRIKSIVFVDNKTGYYANKNALFKTINAGVDWENKIKSIDFFNDIFFIDSITGWAIEPGGRIVHTTDGGKTWLIQKSYFFNEQNQIFFYDQLNGWIVGKDGFLIATKDGGESWTLKSSNTVANLNDIFFTDKHEGWIVGDTGTLLHTTDGGEHWTRLKLSDITNL
jgi:photosystem II stability/assembly factor-like uncharacterized protein